LNALDSAFDHANSKFTGSSRLHQVDLFIV
jgi:hypothetical protein